MLYPVNLLAQIDPAIPDMSMETPVLITSLGIKYSDAVRDYNMTIGIERSHGGRFWAA
jgi:hypothetical protein